MTGPVAIIDWIGIGHTPRGQRDFRASLKWDVLSAGKFKEVRSIAGPYAARVYGRGDADELHLWPPQEHGQGTGVVRIAAEVGVEMDLHKRRRLRPSSLEPEAPLIVKHVGHVL